MRTPHTTPIHTYTHRMNELFNTYMAEVFKYIHKHFNLTKPHANKYVNTMPCTSKLINNTHKISTVYVHTLELAIFNV